MRKLTLEVLVDMDKAGWIWQSHMTAVPHEGVRIVSISEGHCSCLDITDEVCNITGKDPNLG